MVIEARLHSLKHGLVFPSGDQSLLAGGAAMLDSANLKPTSRGGWARIELIIEADPDAASFSAEWELAALA
jgi:hypothetical protein